MNKQQIQQQVIDRIYENTNNEISGEILQQILLNILTLTNDGLSFGGIVNVNSYPLPDVNVFYLFTESGYFTHFNLLVDDNSIKIGLIKYDTTNQQYKYETLLSGNYVQSILIGATVTTEPGSMAAVTNTGTGNNVVLNFYIPRGQQGPQGSQGQQGPQGIPGPMPPNPFKGWWSDLATLKAAITAQPGDSAYVKDASPATTWSIYVYDSTASSDNYWADSGTDADSSNVQTFASGEEVNQTYIDDTNLKNPSANAVAKASDTMQIEYRLQGLTTHQEKLVGSVKEGYYININGDEVSYSSCNYITYNVSGYNKVRFLTRYIGTSGISNTQIRNSGYALYDNNNNPLKVSCGFPQQNSELTHEHIIAVGNAVTLKINIPDSHLSSAYCYGVNGLALFDEIGESSDNISINLNDAMKIYATITSNNVWSYNSGGHGRLIKLTRKSKKIRIVAHESNEGIVAFLKSPSYVNSSTPDFVANHVGRIAITAGETYEFEIDETCNYIYYVNQTSSGITTPQSITLISDIAKKSDVNNVQEQVDTINAKISFDENGYEIDLGLPINLNKFIDSSNEWANIPSTSNVRAGYVELPNFGTCDIKITTGGQTDNVFAFLKTVDTSTSTPNFDDDYTHRLVYSKIGSTYSFELNTERCRYLYFSIKSARNLDNKIASAKLESINNASSKKQINILSIGNSFDQSYLAYAPKILTDLLPDYDIRIYQMYHASARFIDHIENYTDPTFYSINKWEHGASSWIKDSSHTTSTKDLVEGKSWNIIQSGLTTWEVEGTGAASVETYLQRGRQLLRMLQQDSNYGFSWMLSMAGQHSENINNWISAMQVAMQKFGVNSFHPIGTAIWDARTNDYLDGLGDGGHMLYSDNTHLQAGIPVLLATYVFVANVLKYLGLPISMIYGNKWLPTNDNCIEIGCRGVNASSVIMTHGDSVGVEDGEQNPLYENIFAVQEIAIIAINNPYDIVDCSDIIINE